MPQIVRQFDHRRYKGMLARFTVYVACERLIDLDDLNWQALQLS